MITLTILILFLALLLTTSLKSALRSDLRSIPGPFLAKFTDLWRLYVTWKRTFRQDIAHLHAQNESACIRLGPNLISCNDPAAIEHIYGFHNNLRKSDLAKAMVPIFRRKRLPTMFLAASPEEHQQIRAPVAGAYTMTSVLRGQWRVDHAMERVFERLDGLFGDGGRDCDIHNWVHYFSADIMFELTMGEPIGLVEAGGDVEGVLATMAEEFDYRGLVLAMPLLDDLIRLNPLKVLFKPNQMPASVRRARRLLQKAKEIHQAGETSSPESSRPESSRPESSRPESSRPIVFDFLRAVDKHPEIDDGQLMGYIQQNVSAGADTTSIVLRTAIYCALKSPWILDKIRAELDTHNAQFPISYRQARFELRFCAAVVREALRWHFPFVALMEREVPKDTVLTLPGGVHLTGGTVVGMHPGVVQRNRDIFGPDADAFNPLRWFRAPDEDVDAFERRLSKMAACELSLGHGPRACLGRTVAEMVLYKFVPNFFLHYDVALAKPEEPWHVRSLFLEKQSNMDVRLLVRNK